MTSALTASAGGRSPGHDAPIVGLDCDACNKLLVSVCQAGVFRTWHFKTAAPAERLALPSAVEAVAMHAHSLLVAVACTDAVIRVIDAQRCCAVRQFRGHRDRPTAVCVSADAKWVLSASLDGTLRVWDVPAAACLQVLDLGAVATSVALAPGGELLATTHKGARGVSLWSNRLLFGGSAGAGMRFVRHSEVSALHRRCLMGL